MGSDADDGHPRYTRCCRHVAHCGGGDMGRAIASIFIRPKLEIENFGLSRPITIFTNTFVPISNSATGPAAFFNSTMPYNGQD
jgi:hypothetical protein